MIETWEKAYDSDIEVEPGHIIGRSKGIQTLKEKLCRYNLDTHKREPGQYELDTLHITIEDEPLYRWNDNKIKIGASFFDKQQIYRVLQEIFNKKIILKDGSRAIKKEIGKKYSLTVQKPVLGIYPLIVMHYPYSYVIAPCLEDC